LGDNRCGEVRFEGMTSLGVSPGVAA